MNTIDNFAIVVYTNQAYIPILQLFLDEFYEWNPDVKIPIYVLSNSFPTIKPYNEKVTYIEAGVDWDPYGRHFSKVVKASLEKVKEDYIFWFCEDYILNDAIDIKKLNGLLQLFKDKQLDVFSFASIVHAPEYEKIEAEYNVYGLEGETFFYTDNDYLHKFSVQPCIWKKDSLIKLVNENDISLHDLDCSRVIEREKYIAGCTSYRIFDVCPTCPEKFIISYVEVIRHGVFQFTENGLNVDKVYNDYLRKLVIKYNIHEKQEYNKFISFDKCFFTTLDI